MTLRIHDLPRQLRCSDSFRVRVMAEAVLAGRPSFLSAHATDAEGTPLLLYTRFDRAQGEQQLIIDDGRALVTLAPAQREALEQLRETSAA